MVRPLMISAIRSVSLPSAWVIVGRLGSFMARWKAPACACSLKVPAPVAIIGVGSAGEVIRMDIVIAKPGVAVEALAALATGSTTFVTPLVPQPVVRRAAGRQTAPVARTAKRARRVVALKLM